MQPPEWILPSEVKPKQALACPCGGSRWGRQVSEGGEPDLWCALALEKVLSHTQELPGAWVLGQSAGGCRNNSGFPSNPKFWLRVSEPSEVYIAVLQKPRMRTVDWAGRAQAPVGDSRVVWSPASILGKDYPAVGLHLWKVTPLGQPPTH